MVIMAIIPALSSATPEPSPAATPLPLECPPGAICVGNCNELEAEGGDSEDVSVCRHYFNSSSLFSDTRPHSHVVKIPANLQNLFVTGDKNSPLPIMTQEGTLFIFDSDTEEGLPEDTLVEYDLPKRFTLPSNSALVGNGKSGKKPEITIPDNASSDFIIQTDNQNADYLLADIEVDSREIPQLLGHSGVLDLKVAKTVTLDQVKIVRKQVTPIHDGGEA